MIIKNTARFITVAALFLIPIFALIVVDTLFFPFITGKAFYFRILIEIAFAGWLVLAFADPRYRPKWTPLTIAISLFALITLVANLIGVNPMRSLWSNFERMEGWVTIIHLWALYMVAMNTFGAGEEGRRIWHRWFNFELLVAFAVGIYGVVQLLGGAAIHQGSTRIDASLGNAAYMAVYMLWNVGIAVYMTFMARARKISGSELLQWIYPALAIFFAFLLFQTSTRGTILGLIGGTFLALLAYAIFAGKDAKRSRWISGGLLALIVIVGITFWSLRSQPFIKNNEVLNRLASISLSNTESTARLYIWSMAGQGFLNRPVLGWGQENFNYIFNAYYNPKLYSQEQWFDRAHSVYLDWLTASGLVGLLAYLSLYVLFLVAVWKSELPVGVKSVLTGLLAGYAVHNIFVFDNLASYILFFSSLAFVGSFKEGKPIKFFGTEPMSSEAIEYVVTPVVVVLLVVGFYFLNARQMKASTSLIRAVAMCSSKDPNPILFLKPLSYGVTVANQEIREQLLSCAGSAIRRSEVVTDTKKAFYTLAITAIQDQIKSAKIKDARTYALAGSFMNNISQYAEAVKYLEVAHELSPNKQTITSELALDLINMNQADKAVPMLKAAYEAVPQNTSVKAMYALSLVVTGKEAEARQSLGNDASIFETFQMGQAYMAIKQYTKALAIFKKLSAASPDDVNLSVQVAQVQYVAGMKSEAIATLRAVAKKNPQYAEQIEASIKAAQ